jgi:DNA (cytosine-5)-methyltransferase 1
MIHFSLFSGLGGFDLAAESVGWRNYLSCEINPFCGRVLSHYWPQAYHHTDIKTLTYDTINTELSKRFGQEWRDDDIVLSGGFPCQPFSTAGRRMGKEDERHLWPEMLRLIGEIKPTYIVGENVRGLISWNEGMVFDEVFTDLESKGYQVQSFVLPAAGINAPHKRERVWFVAADTNSLRLQQCTNTGEVGGRQEEVGCEGSGLTDAIETNGTTESATDTNGNGLQGSTSSDINRQLSGKEGGFEERIYTRRRAIPFSKFPTQPPVCGRDDGLPTQLDGVTFPSWRRQSVMGYGNAIVPQIAINLFKTIEKCALL